MGNGMYVYKETDLTTEYFYHKKWQMNFIIDLGYFEGGVPLEEAGRKCL